VNAQNSLKLVAALCFVSLGLAAYGQTSPADVPSPTKAAPSTQAKVHYGQLPLSFEPIAARRRATCSGWRAGRSTHSIWPVLTRCCR